MTRVMYVSNMTVSPGSGGGNTVFNLLEPAPEGSEVFYAFPRNHPDHWTPFPELTDRISWFSTPIHTNHAAGLRKHVNRVTRAINNRLEKFRTISHLQNTIERKAIDLLLVCPQGSIVETAKIVKGTHLPVISWFMDNYYTDGTSTSLVDQICKRSASVFVVSESMQRYFLERFDCTSEILNNSVTFPAFSPTSAFSDHRPLRVVYTGALHSYYNSAMLTVLSELGRLKRRVLLDIYSFEEPSSELAAANNGNCRYLPPVAAGDLVATLRKYDALLMLSSFRSEHRAIAETSLASKWADYLAAGRPIVVFGPAYAENVGYSLRHQFAEVVTSEDPGKLAAGLASLVDNDQRREVLAYRAFKHGLQKHNKAINRERLWSAIFQAAKSSGVIAKQHLESPNSERQLLKETDSRPQKARSAAASSNWKYARPLADIEPDRQLMGSDGSTTV
jgi:glycosyltransferase involved in cell wall biosynthesis